MDDQAIEALAAEALDLAVAHIQDKLGVQTGDLAGQWFADGSVTETFSRYMRLEMAYLRASDVLEDCIRTELEAREQP